MKAKRQFAVAIAAVSMMAVQVVCADVVEYWKFENNSTGSERGWGLSAAGTAGFVSLPASGAGSAFPDPIGGAANDYAATFDGANDLFYRSDLTAMAVTDFTIEALINSTDGEGSIVGQWSMPSGAWERSWKLKLNGGVLGMALSHNGSTAESVSSGITLTTGKDYFVAASLDLSETTGGLVFYVQNLTDGGAMQSVAADHANTSLRNSGGNFSIAADADWSNDFEGLIDEVRWSNTVLSQSALLVPEPATMGLLGIGGMFVAFMRRRFAK